MADQENYVIDGIQQQSGTVPRWWSNTMFALMGICPLFMLYFHIGAPGRSAADYYEKEVAAAARARFAEIGTLEPNGPTILEYMEKDNWVKVGKVVFKSNCANCHGQSGEGLIGPNLTDEKYKHIRSVGDIATVILKGANNNAMPAWEEKLDVNEIVMVSAYVANLRGTNADGGKAAEGADIPSWGAAAP